MPQLWNYHPSVASTSEEEPRVSIFHKVDANKISLALQELNLSEVEAKDLESAIIAQLSKVWENVSKVLD